MVHAARRARRLLATARTVRARADEPHRPRRRATVEVSSWSRMLPAASREAKTRSVSKRTHNCAREQRAREANSVAGGTAAATAPRTSKDPSSKKLRIEVHGSRARKPSFSASTTSLSGSQGVPDISTDDLARRHER